MGFLVSLKELILKNLNLKLKRYCDGNNFLFIDNDNINESCLNNSKLHLNQKGTNVLCENIKKSLYNYWSSQTHRRKIDITNLNLTEDIDQILFDLRCKNPSNLNFAYLNINSIRNKFENLISIINGNVDVFMIAETKLDGSFPPSQFEIRGYYSPFRLDITKKSGGLLVYIKSSIPSRKRSCDGIHNSIQAIPFEINLRKEKWLVISIYRPPSQDSVFFLNSLTKMIDLFADKYDNYLIMGDFNWNQVTRE